MAIRTDLTTDFGVIPDAYIRVTSFSGDKLSVKFSFAGYINQAARESEADPVLVGEYTIAFIDGNVLVAAYDHLKIVFSGAVDA